ncbi:UDP-glucose:2-hydroxyflavanone C-glucosyltransferase-like, partial [Phalaenopsis equestris]|uniref:UDP-glucose:2-hydroxyflavanone C-glucosyltransferase-like n=1 Tax=Phalaenopsis equestris TaxID=78828 RepID=UPI0009E4D434
PPPPPRRIAVSLIASRPTISAAESDLLSSLPPSILLDFPLAPLNTSLFPASSDPFLLRMEALRLSAHLLPPLISSSGPFSSLIVDISIASTFLPVAASINIPCFVLFTSSAAMLAFCSVFTSSSNAEDDIDIAGIVKIPSSSFPQPLHDPNHFFKTQFVENGKALTLASGILVNTFTALEPNVLVALNSGEVVPRLPPVIAVGPLLPERKQSVWQPSAMRWLDKQPERSVIYVCFGSRTAMTREQIMELGAGLEMSGCPFFWVMKSKMVDREEMEEIEELLGEGYVKRVEGRGLVLMEWVEQEVILAHRSVGVFLSHCGWNSMMEAVAAGVRVLAWPRGGDQRVNAAVVAGSGLGVWPEKWVWEGEEGVVGAKEIAKKLSKLIVDDRMGETTAKLAAEAAAAVEKVAAEAAAAVVAERGNLINGLVHLDDKVIM